MKQPLRNKLFAMLYLLFFMTAASAQNALDFDGVNDYVQTTYDGISGNSARTFEAWIKTTANANPSAGGVQKVITDYGTFTTGARFTFNVLWGNAIRIEVGGSGLSGHIPVNNGAWHHVAGVYDPNATNKISLYVDGILDTMGNIPTLVNTGTTVDLAIGRRIDAINPFDGSIDEVRVWNTARTQAQIQANMNAEICSAPGLVAYYRFNHGIASGTNTGVTTLVDYSGGSNNGTLTNFALSGTSSNWVAGASLTPAVGGSSTLTPTACESYTSPSGKVWTSSNTYQDTVQNALGCDSMITVNLTILNPSSDSFATTACDSYLSPSGNYLWSSTGIYRDTLVNAAGCDSIVTVDLTINTQTTSFITPVACDSYTSPSGNNTWTASGTYQDIIPNSKGCDSVITIMLTITGSTNFTFSDMACDSYTSPSGKIWTSSGTYLDTIANAAGCDSLLIVNLTVNSSSSNTLTETTCDSYTSPSGKYTWTTSGTYLDTLTNASGCPEWLTINLTVVEVDTGVTLSLSGIDLVAFATGAAYQWLDCDNNYAPITGANQQTFSPLVSGSYAVQVTENGCVDTSACVPVIGVGVSENTFETPLALYPNPTSDRFFLDFGKAYRNVVVEVYDLNGRLVYSSQLEESEQTSVDLGGNASGIYLVRVKAEQRRAVFRVSVK